ncbi:4-hydroxy-3-polyprenylbenzoate decarboxylase [Steroidobacter denitrificans]|uniref:Flavin prenyltransferase UbiX n=1 Tax=Steroidobacter denitrificans TaxID=465721 RepID=A0A127FDG3_STEDE|nr:4-hydroxy-3-polyprenylbenzoate decarboxylase [Steroidobacter denitrificans]
MRRRLIVGISGASGVIYGIRALQMLRDAGNIEVHLVMSAAAKLNIRLETDWSVSEVEALASKVYDVKDLAASISSGSYRTVGMLVAPCSIKTLSAIACSHSDNLLTRAADVVVKERRRLVLMVRETPLHAGHCELLLKVAALGVIVAPPIPAFYNRPATLDDLVNHSVGRILDLFDIDVPALKRWEGIQSPQSFGSGSRDR